MNYNNKKVSKGFKRFQKVSKGFFAVITLFALISVSPVFASSVSGGAMTLNIDSNLLASAFTNDNDPNRPSAYLEEYFNSSQAASRTPGELLSDHIIPEAGQISGINRQFSVNSSTTSGSNIANNFSFSANDLTGTASGAIGLGGAMRFRLDIPFTVDPLTGDEQGNRAITGYYSLEYDTNRVDAVAGHSGWTIFNHYSFRADIFDLDNVVTNITGSSLTLSGDIALASGFDHMGGQQGAIVGDFNFQTTVVPVPAAVWLFTSALAGLISTRQFAARRTA